MLQSACQYCGNISLTTLTSLVHINKTSQPSSAVALLSTLLFWKGSMDKGSFFTRVMELCFQQAVYFFMISLQKQLLNLQVVPRWILGIWLQCLCYASHWRADPALRKVSAVGSKQEGICFTSEVRSHLALTSKLLAKICGDQVHKTGGVFVQIWGKWEP